MARPAHGPDPPSRRQVEAMAGYGVPETDIAKVVDIDPKTLRKYYRKELDTGAIKATARVAEFLYKKATTEGPQCVTAAIFWLKTRGAWKETSVQEIAREPQKMIVRWLDPSPPPYKHISTTRTEHGPVCLSPPIESSGNATDDPFYGDS